MKNTMHLFKILAYSDSFLNYLINQLFHLQLKRPNKKFKKKQTNIGILIKT